MQKQEIPPPAATPASAAKVAAIPGVVSGNLNPVVEESSFVKSSRGRYHFISLNTQNTFEDSVYLTQLLFIKELVHETRRVKIENLDKQNFRVSMGPFTDLNEANRQLQKINQVTFLKASVVTFEKAAPTSSDAGYQPFIQINAQGNLDNAVTLTQTLMEKALLEPMMFVEVVNFGAGNYRVRYGPFKNTREAGQNIQNLKKQLKVSPILVNLERLVSFEGR